MVSCFSHERFYIRSAVSAMIISACYQYYKQNIAQISCYCHVDESLGFLHLDTFDCYCDESNESVSATAAEESRL